MNPIQLSREPVFQEKTVVITGGNSGIGKACALTFASSGANVLITGRQQQTLTETENLHPNIKGVVADLQHEAQVRAAIQKAITLWGKIDVLVNNAGMVLPMPLAESTLEMMQTLFNTNVIGPSLFSREALPHLTKTNGTIINISSTYGHKAAANLSHYAASKAALEQLTTSWALELAPVHIRVNAVAPGPTETPILQRIGLEPDALEAIKQHEINQIPLHRRGTPEEIAWWVMLLASSQAGWLTGQVISVDGGLSIA